MGRTYPSRMDLTPLRDALQKSLNILLISLASKLCRGVVVEIDVDDLYVR